MADATRACDYCGDELPADAHFRRKFCTRNCKDSAAWRKHYKKKPAERCAGCNVRMPEGKRPHALYCTRACKSSAYSRANPASPAENRERYRKEREHRLEYSKQYQKDNPHVPKRAKRKRKSRMAGVGVLHISAKDWNRLVARHHGKCFYCGASGRMSMDHVVPISRDGRHSIGNVLPACITCNSSKRNRTIMEWRLGRSVRRARTTSPAAAHDRSSVGENERRKLVSA
jgi:5-methylcytosine-specific restriction endonuclease McrA